MGRRKDEFTWLPRSTSHALRTPAPFYSSVIMSATPIASVSFYEAELRSERLRLLALIGFLTIVVCVTAIRVFVVRTVAGTNTWIWSILLAAGAIAYEAWMLRKVTLALKANHVLPAQFWFVSTIVETSIPAFALAFLTSKIGR